MDSGADPQLDALLTSVEKLNSYQYKRPGDKRRAEGVLRRVAYDLQTPFDMQMEIWGSIMRDAALKTCLDVGVFAHMASGKDTWTLDELTTACGNISKELLSMLLKHLAAYHLIHERFANTYALTPYSRLLGGPDLGGAITTLFEAWIPTFVHAPILFEKLGYVRPTTSNQTMLADATGTTGHIFDYAKTNGALADGFDRAMRAFAGLMGDWVDVVPIEEMLSSSLSCMDGRVLVVDVGGGYGHDLHKLVHKLPLTRDRVVLQEQDYVIEKALPHLDGVKGMVHDFFSTNPVQGARVYFLHHVLHDWPDYDCRRILRGITSVMAADSRILVVDLVLPPQGATKHETTYDLIMMSALGGKERNEGEWDVLMASVGLKVVKIWRSDEAMDAILEIVLV